MIPPTSIDGTDITGATIDGTDVQEITVDGQTVFSASNLPVAYSNLVAWYPFDSATYGGSNADDVTAILGGSGDDTPYDGTVNGATYQSSGGVTDINAGANSGAFEFDGSNDNISIVKDSSDLGNAFTVMAFANYDNVSGNSEIISNRNTDNYNRFFQLGNPLGGDFGFYVNDGSVNIISTSGTENQFVHLAGVYDNGALELFVDGNLEATGSANSYEAGNDEIAIGSRVKPNEFHDGIIDDVRIYDVALSASQINQIYQNTKP